MPTTPTAFAQTTRVSTNPAELKRRTLALYRQFMRQSPNFVEMYEMDVPTAIVRSKLRQEFERNRHVADLNVRNILLAQGQMEFQETINFWKQPSHVLKYFDDYQAVQIEKLPDNFVRRFIKGSLA